METIIKILTFIWRLWFYILVFTTILIAFPILIFIISNNRLYPLFYKIAHIWGKVILFCMGFTTKIEMEEEIDLKRSYIFCPNHTSFIDIILMLALSKNPFVFVGKKELANVPLFGFIYKKTCILVDRNDTISRKNALLYAKEKIKQGLSICIFPEGHVPDDESIILDHFKNGAFRLAIEFQIPIVPITLYDCKKHFPFSFFRGSPGTLRVKVHKFINTLNLNIEDRIGLKNDTYQVIYNSLLEGIKNQQ